MMVEDASLVWAWFGFVFLMLLFRAPFAAETIRIYIVHVIRRLRVVHAKTLMDRHEARRRRPVSV